MGIGNKELGRFKIWELVERDEIEGLQQEKLEKILDSIDGKEPWRLPIISVYYEIDGKSYYEHFCRNACAGMFWDRAKELQKGIDEGTIGKVKVFETMLKSEMKEVGYPLEETGKAGDIFFKKY